MKPTRFGRAPIIPSKKKFLHPGRPSKGISSKEIKEEEGPEGPPWGEREEKDDAEELLEVVEPKYFRFTSLRLLVWINFILVILLMISFLVYILTRSPTHPSLKSVDEYEGGGGGKKMLLFNLVPDKESNERWAIISLKSSEIDVHKLEDIWVCCTKDSIYSCDGYHVSFFLEKKEAKISIKHPNQIGSTCRLFWH